MSYQAFMNPFQNEVISGIEINLKIQIKLIYKQRKPAERQGVQSRIR